MQNKERDKLYRIILKRRTIRFFKKRIIHPGIIRKVINAARVAPSAANLQFIEYIVIDKSLLKDKVFSCTKWGGYVFPKRVPDKDKMPSFYIMVLINKNKSIKPDLRDVGAAVENILISLLSFGLSACWIANVDRRRLRKIIKLPSYISVDSVVACGIGDENPVLEESVDRVRYWLDKNNRLHVPKRPLKNVLHYNRF